ncbi:hypothetical protein [Halalkalibacter alkalisediminis]|uniref:ABC transporter permease n=1 Tax=Halalkalibacter alkalisediminis TaxID=935616 RepID=A0ABV6NP06_9BACI|nr:hypothetical protein [Halalkalibacter alkalisediminis]
MYQQAFWLAKKEFKSQWVAIALTLVVTIFLALVSAALLEQSVRKLSGTETIFYNRMLLDIMFVGLTPSFAAIFMSRPYLNFQTIKDDPFSKRMAFFRTLPIPVSILSLSRIFLMVGTLIIMSFAFYLTITIAVPAHFFELMTPVEYLIFILFWLGYALAIGGVNPFVEYGTNGKILHLLPWVFIVVFLITVFIFYSLVGLSIVEMILVLIKSHGWPLAAVSIFVGVCGSYIWNKLLTMRLSKRDYL